MFSFWVSMITLFMMSHFMRLKIVKHRILRSFILKSILQIFRRLLFIIFLIMELSIQRNLFLFAKIFSLEGSISYRSLFVL